jgi:hypothetical protein
MGGGKQGTGTMWLLNQNVGGDDRREQTCIFHEKRG